MTEENQDLSSSKAQLDKSNFKNFWEFLQYLLTDKKGLSTLIIGVSLLIGSFFLIFYFTKPQKIEITSSGGSISFEKGGTKGTIFLLSPTGGKDSPWVKTGIKVKKGDKVKITATGQVHLSLKKLVYYVQNQELNDLPWSGPEGIPEDKASIVLPDNRKNYRVRKKSKYGTLLAAIDSEKPIEIGAEKTFPTETDGEILLTINDIWLSEEIDDQVYIPNLTLERNYYIRKVQEVFYLRNSDFLALSKKEQDEKIKKVYEQRKKDWLKIKKDGNWRVWYDDNSGSFSVAITVNAD